MRRIHEECIQGVVRVKKRERERERERLIECPSA